MPARPCTGLRTAVATLVCLTALACLTTPPSADRAEPPSRRTEISRAEIETVLPHVGDAYQLVEQLRPGMFISRDPWRATAGAKASSAESGSIVVYVDGVRRGDIEMLKRIPAHSVVRIQRLSQADASFRYGPGHPGGAIVVQTETAVRLPWITAR